MGTRKTKEQIIAKFQSVHGDRYDYSRFVYVNYGVKGEIICQKHGSFWQDPGNHIRGTNCPKCSKKHKLVGSFKEKCQALGVNYWRALKRREAGLSEEEIFNFKYIRSARKINPITVNGVTYPNLGEAKRQLNSTVSTRTVNRRLKDGMSPEEAFEKVPNPGYTNGIIYKVTNTISGKIYIGLTVQTLEVRWNSHIEQANAGHIKNPHSLHAAIRKYGANNFLVEIIDRGVTKKDLEEKERYWIETLNSLMPAGYNICPGGVSGGANGKPTTVDGIKFQNQKQAAEYVAKTRNISRHAAKRRICKNKIDIRTPSKPGSAITKTKAYKSWSRIVHGLVNSNSKSYDSTIELCDRWRDFYDFLEDVGQPPQPNMSFCRVDKSKGYFPGNCKWLTRSDAAKLNAKHQWENKRTLGKPGDL